MRGVTKMSAVKGQRWYKLIALKDRCFVIAGALMRERKSNGQKSGTSALKSLG